MDLAEPLPPTTALPPRLLRSRRELHVVFLVLSLAVLAVAALLSVRGPTEVDLPLVGQSLPVLCHWKRLTGIDCPGCGMTRCFVALAHGDFASAWRFNPAGILLFILVAAQVPYRSLQLWRLARGQNELTLRRLTSVRVAALLVAMFLQWFWKLYLATQSWNA
jgi:hypothetical protein